MADVSVSFSCDTFFKPQMNADEHGFFLTVFIRVIRGYSSL